MLRSSFGIFRQELLLKLGFERRETLACFADLAFGELARVGVLHHFFGRVQIVLGRLIRLVEIDDGRNLGMLARELAIVVDVARHVRRGEERIQFVHAQPELPESCCDAGFHSGRLML